MMKKNLWILAALLFLGCTTQTPSVRPSAHAANGTLSGFISIRPLCPVERIGYPCRPTPQTFQAYVLEATSEQDSQTQKFFGTIPDGFYNLSLEPGEYQIQTIGTTNRNRPGNYGPARVQILSDQVTSLNISIDTGIR